VATGTPETKLARELVVVYLEVYRLVIVPYGIMAQIAQKRLYFKCESTTPSDPVQNAPKDVFIDIASCLTAVNRKQYHQVTASGDPLCYTVTVTNIKSGSPLKFCTAPNTWTTRNAVKKTAVGWKAQMKNSGIRMSELPTYARRFRAAFNFRGVDAAANTQHLKDHMCPDGCDESRLFTPYVAPDGGTVTYENANDITLLALDDGGDDYKCVLTGDTTTTGGHFFGMIYEYLKSRRNMREESDPTTEFPDTDGLMNTLFATSEELADDVTEAVDEYMIARPYSESDASDAVFAGYVESGTTNYRETFSAPLGLISLDSGWIEDDEFIIDVEAVYEM
jgi:hypothetical protein